jgi:transcriptional regulator with XRE-family HTH domain
MDMRKLVGSNVRKARLKAGLTQERLAETSGYSQQYISGLEQGLRNPTIITIFELATALGVSHIDLIRPTRLHRR